MSAGTCLTEGNERMSSYNRVILLANCTRDPEMKYLPSGTAVTELGLAVNDRIKRGEQWVDEAAFVDCSLFGRTAEIANEYLSKGSQCLIEGRLKYSQWEKDGIKRSKLTVIADKLQLVGSKGERREAVPAAQVDASEFEMTDDVPF